MFFFFSSRRRHTRCSRDWSSDVCSSDLHILEPRCDFWDIEFPSLHKAEEALARLLMECSFCQRREVVYLNEMQLKSFEVRRCVARHCRHCESPSIWIESLSEAAGLEGDGTHPAEERVVPRRNRARVKARVLACIRRRGFAEEVVVCEDLSKGDRKSTRLNSSHGYISYAVFCLKK